MNNRKIDYTVIFPTQEVDGNGVTGDIFSFGKPEVDEIVALILGGQQVNTNNVLVTLQESVDQATWTTTVRFSALTTSEQIRFRRIGNYIRAVVSIETDEVDPTNATAFVTIVLLR